MVAVSCESSSLTRGSKYSGFDLETLGILENWSLTRGGRNQRFDCIFWVRPGTDMVTILCHFGTFFDEHFLRRLKNTWGGVLPYMGYIPQRVWFFSRFGHKLGIDFSHFAAILVINRVSIFAL